VGNNYEEAREPLLGAVGQQPIVDLTRLDRSVRSNGTYQGICW
jgi:GDP-mannose 6-dehydrogenase